MITDIASFLPTGRLTNERLVAELGRWTPEEVFAKTGIRSRTIAAADETAVDLAAHAVSRLQARAGAAADFLLLCTQTADYKLPSSACLLQARVGLPADCGCFDINLACSGYIYGLMTAQALIVAGMAKRVILANSDTYTHYIHPQDAVCRPLFGDGAAATLLSSGSTTKVEAFVTGSNGVQAMSMHLPAGGEKQRAFRADAASQGGPNEPEFIRMDGPEIYNFTLKVVPAAVSACLAKAGITAEQVDHFVFHQANAFMLEALRRKLGIPPEKFPIELAETGNLVSASIPIVLEKMRVDGRIRPGSCTLLCGFGVGLSWGACLVRW